MSIIPPARLAEIPPQRWNEIKSRMEAVARFLDQPDRSTKAILRHAAEIGVSRPMFYKLLANRARWMRTDADVQPSRASAPKAATATARAIVEEAIALCGPAATQRLVYEKAIMIAFHRGLVPPNNGLVRRLHGRRGAGAAFPARLGLPTPLAGRLAVVDAAPLAVLVPGRDVRARAAVLCGVLDQCGILVAHRVTSGSPGRDDVVDLLSCAREYADAADIVVTHALDESVLDDVGDQELRPKRGSAIVAAVGTRLGRIAVTPFADPDRPDGDLPTVTFEDLRDVVDLLLRGQSGG